MVWVCNGARVDYVNVSTILSGGDKIGASDTINGGFASDDNHTSLWLKGHMGSDVNQDDYPNPLRGDGNCHADGYQNSMRVELSWTSIGSLTTNDYVLTGISSGEADPKLGTYSPLLFPIMQVKNDDIFFNQTGIFNPLGISLWARTVAGQFPSNSTVSTQTVRTVNFDLDFADTSSGYGVATALRKPVKFVLWFQLFSEMKRGDPFVCGAASTGSDATSVVSNDTTFQTVQLGYYGSVGSDHPRKWAAYGGSNPNSTKYNGFYADMTASLDFSFWNLKGNEAICCYPNFLATNAPSTTAGKYFANKAERYADSSYTAQMFDISQQVCDNGPYDLAPISVIGDDLKTKVLSNLLSSTTCDTYMTNWCVGANLTRAECSCIAPSVTKTYQSSSGAVIPIANLGNAPVYCVDADCHTRGGYVRQGELKVGCNLVICTQLITSDGTSIFQTDNTQTQTCTSNKTIVDTTSTDTTSTDTTSTSTNPPAPGSPAAQQAQIGLYLMIGGALLFLGVVYLLVIRKKPAVPQPSYYAPPRRGGAIAAQVAT